MAPAMEQLQTLLFQNVQRSRLPRGVTIKAGVSGSNRAYITRKCGNRFISLQAGSSFELRLIQPEFLWIENRFQDLPFQRGGASIPEEHRTIAAIDQGRRITRTLRAGDADGDRTSIRKGPFWVMAARARNCVVGRKPFVEE